MIGFRPVDYAEPVVNIIRSKIIVLQVIRMFPDVDTKHRTYAQSDGCILIRCCNDFESAPVKHEPGVSGAEDGECGLFESLLELIESAKADVNGCQKISGRLFW